MSLTENSDHGGTKKRQSPTIWVLANCHDNHMEFMSKLITLRAKCNNIVGVSVAVNPNSLPDVIPHTPWPVDIKLIDVDNTRLPKKYTDKDLEESSKWPLAVRKFLKPKQKTDAVLYIDFSQSRKVDDWIEACTQFDINVHECLFVPQEAFTQKAGKHVILAKTTDKGIYPVFGGDMNCSICKTELWYSVEARPCEVTVKVCVENGGVGSARSLVGTGYGWCLDAQEKGIKIWAYIP